MPKPLKKVVECRCTSNPLPTKLKQTPCCNISCENNKIEISHSEVVELAFELYAEGKMSEEKLNELIVKI